MSGSGAEDSEATTVPLMSAVWAAAGPAASIETTRSRRRTIAPEYPPRRTAASTAIAVSGLLSRLPFKLSRDERRHARALQDAPVERVRRHRRVVTLVEEDDRLQASVRVVDVVEGLEIPLEDVTPLAERAELADHQRLLELEERRVRLLENLVEAPPARPGRDAAVVENAHAHPVDPFRPGVVVLEPGHRDVR